MIITDLFSSKDACPVCGQTPCNCTHIAESVNPIANKILDLCQKIYAQGDDAFDHVYHNAPLFAQFWDQYEGDLDSIVSEVSPKNLQRIYAELLPLAQEEGLAEGANDQVYTIDITRHRMMGPSSTRSTSGTLAELIEYFGYTLEVGKSYEHERGRYKINMNPKNIQSLVDNLNKAQANAAANGNPGTSYSVSEKGVAEAVTLDRSKNPNYPNDPATVKHRLDTAKAILSNPNSDSDSRRAAAAIIAKLEKGVAEGDYNIRRDPTYQKYDPETHTMMYKDGKHKLIKHDQVAKARALGWKVRSSLKAFAKGQGGVAEGLESYPEVLYHGSTQEIKGPLTPRQAHDIGGAPGSNKNAIYATDDPNFAIAYSLAERGSDTGTFGWKKDPHLIFFGGKIRHGENAYIHVLPTRDAQGRPLFVRGAADAEWHSVPGVKAITPIKIEVKPVDQYLHLLRKPTPEELKIFQANQAKDKAQKQGVAEGNKKPEPPEADYGDEYQAMVARVKKLAGLGPLKTVYDPQKRVYRNMPTAQQPPKK